MKRIQELSRSDKENGSIMDNWVICPVHNNLVMTKKAVETFKKQDIGNVRVLLIDNGSTDNTARWVASQEDLFCARFDPQIGVAGAWNYGLQFVFRYSGVEYALVVNNDVELRPDTYRWLVADGGGFVTAVGTNDPEKIKPRTDMIQATAKEHLNPDSLVTYGQIKNVQSMYHEPSPYGMRPHPDFSCFLIRQQVYEKVGPFDEKFKMAYCEDGDYDLRMWQQGIRGYCIDLPFLHHGAGTINNTDLKEQRIIHMNAELNREYFFRKHGCRMGSPEYYQRLEKDKPPKEN